MELDKDDNLDGLDVIPQPPKTLNSLKLYGHVNKLLVWTWQLPNLEKLKLDMTIAKPEVFRKPQDPDNHYFRGQHIRIRPIQDGDLIGPCWTFARAVEIQCTSILHINFEGRNDVWWNAVVLKVQFAGGSQSFLQISWLSGWTRLKEVWFKGYNDQQKQYIQQQINEVRLDEGQARPVLKLVQTRSS